MEFPGILETDGVALKTMSIVIVGVNRGSSIVIIRLKNKVELRKTGCLKHHADVDQIQEQ